jgi:hypothetical protein
LVWFTNGSAWRDIQRAALRRSNRAPRLTEMIMTANLQRSPVLATISVIALTASFSAVVPLASVLQVQANL